MSCRYLVTPALPYANGPIHLGHLMEHIQTNIFVNALKMSGHDVLCVCGADSHGTPIEINATKEGVKPEKFIKKWQKLHEKSFANFGIIYDGGYGTTHSKKNEDYVVKIFNCIKKANKISKKKIEQFFDKDVGRFLPDRLIKGTCPKCNTNNQYGDNCENCGFIYKAIELINPKSTLSGLKPVFKKSLHYFFELYHYSENLKKLVLNTNVLQKNMQNFLKTWFKEGLKNWDISRDEPYFGFKIPGEKNKYFYVWLDAPICYITLTEYAAKKIGRTVEDYWRDKNTKIIHFIGKDIVYFHTLFWPAILMASNYNLPTFISVHGMLTIDGKKMSKSRGTFILADDYCKFLNPEALRYYFASKLSSTAEDLDLNLNDFKAKINSCLINKIVNIISRTVPLLHRYNDSKIGIMDKEAYYMISEIKIIANKVKQNYLLCKNSKAIKDIVKIAELTNCYLQNASPWNTVKKDLKKAQAQLTTALWCGNVCVGLLNPVLPKMVEEIKKILNIKNKYDFTNILSYFPVGKIIGIYKNLFNRIDNKSIQNLIDISKK